MSVSTHTALESQGVELLHALAVANLNSYFYRLADAQQFLDSLHAGRTDAEVRDLFLSDIAAASVQQLAVTVSPEAATSMLESVSHLRLARNGPRIAKDPTATQQMADLHNALVSYSK